MRTIITTVGTSLKTDLQRGAGITDPTDTDLTFALKDADPARASAETNSLNRLLGEDDALIFVCSATAAARSWRSCCSTTATGCSTASSKPTSPPATSKPSSAAPRGWWR